MERECTFHLPMKLISYNTDTFYTLAFLSWDVLPFLQTENSKVQEKRKVEEQEIKQLMKENDKHNLEISALKQELEIAKKMHEQHCFEVEAGVKGAKAGLQMRIKELECLLADSNNRVKELEVISESKCQRWNMKENIYQSFMDFQFGAMKVCIAFFFGSFLALYFVLQNIIHFTNL